MTILNEAQEQLLASVKTAYDDVTPVLKEMRDEYEFAVYRAKKAIRDAVVAAQDAGVPMSRIVAEATDMKYGQRLKAWLQPAECVVDRVMAGGAVLENTETYAEELNSIETVTRHPSTGKFKVTYDGSDYEVSAMGPDADCWGAQEPGVPEEVYELIKNRFPGFVLLEDDEEDD